MQITLTEDEARVLGNLLDLAVKNAGLAAVAAVHHFMGKLEAAKNSETPENEDAGEENDAQ